MFCSCFNIHSVESVSSVTADYIWWTTINVEVKEEVIFWASCFNLSFLLVLERDKNILINVRSKVSHKGWIITPFTSRFLTCSSHCCHLFILPILVHQNWIVSESNLEIWYWSIEYTIICNLQIHLCFLSGSPLWIRIIVWSSIRFWTPGIS